MEEIKIGQLARRTRISVRTLHHYEEIGLLCSSGRDAAGHRVYTRGDLDRLDQIVSLRELGVSLGEIRLCLDDPARMRRVLESQAQSLQQRIEQLQRTHRSVSCLLERLGKAPVASLLRSTSLLHPKWTDDIMAAMRKRVEEVGEEGWHAAKKENRELVIEAGDAQRRGIPPDDPDVMALACRLYEVRQILTGGDADYAAKLRRMNDEGFARYGPEGGSTDPAVIAYVERAYQASMANR